VRTLDATGARGFNSDVFIEVVYSALESRLLSEAKARSFCGTPPVADPSEAPMNRWFAYFLAS